jgi:GTP-binding protein EngB required for normal cell division
VWFAESEPLAVDPHELAQYATEQGNPDNTRHVARIQVELSAGILNEGITFVDTPGLGSLARSGELESLAYLPRCDLGIVLVDAASALVPEDAAIANALRQAGAEVMVLLTKADMLDPEERTTAAQYTSDRLRTSLGFEMPVHMVSVKGADSELCDQWFEATLLPALQAHRELAASSLRRKVGLLREATITALRRRLDQRSAAAGGLASKWAAAESALGAALTRLEAARREGLEWSWLAGKTLDDAAGVMVDEWRRGGAHSADAAAAVAICGERQVRLAADAVAGSLGALRTSLVDALRLAARSVGSDDDEAGNIPVPAGMPILALAHGLPTSPLHRPLAVRALTAMARRRVRARLAARLGPALSGLLERHARQVAQWRVQTLADMGRSFTAQADFHRAQAAQTSGQADAAVTQKDIERLQALQDA